MFDSTPFLPELAMIQNQSTHLWLARFADRLTEHFTEMNPLSAVKRAIALYPEMGHMDAAAAADQFAADPRNAGDLALRSPTHSSFSPSLGTTAPP